MAGEMQSPREQQVETALKLHDRILYWENFVDNATQEQLEKDGWRAVSELDALIKDNGVFNKPCLASGFGTWCEIIVTGLDSDEQGVDDASKEPGTEAEGDVLVPEEEQPGPSVTYEYKSGKVDAKKAVCYGFTIEKLEDDSRPRLWSIFTLEGVKIDQHSTLLISFVPKMYLKPSSMNVLSVDSLSPEDASVEQEPIDMAELEHYSDGLKRMIATDWFRRADRQRQAAAIDEHIEKAERVSHVKNNELVVGPEFVYKPVVHEGILGYQKIKVNNMTLRGICLGLSMAGRDVLNKRPIRHSGDVLDKQDGISLVIELAEDKNLPKDLSMKPGTVVHVPLSSQDVDVIYVE